MEVPEALEVEMQGEALFNDGIGIVLFTVLFAYAAGSGGEATSAGGVSGCSFRRPAAACSSG